VRPPSICVCVCMCVLCVCVCVCVVCVCMCGPLQGVARLRGFWSPQSSGYRCESATKRVFQSSSYNVKEQRREFSGTPAGTRSPGSLTVSHTGSSPSPGSPCQNGVRMVSEWRQNGVRMVSEWCQNGDRMVSEWCQTVPGT
jgi:hypothetical protein